MVAVIKRAEAGTVGPEAWRKDTQAFTRQTRLSEKHMQRKPQVKGMNREETERHPVI